MSPANKTLWSICLVLSSFSILLLYSLTVVLSSPKVPLFIGLSEICTQIGYVIGVAEPTIQELVSRIPDEIVEIVGRFLTDEEVNTDHIDVQEMMPSQQCVDLIANHLGLSNDDVGTAELDQQKRGLMNRLRGRTGLMRFRRNFLKSTRLLRSRRSRVKYRCGFTQNGHQSCCLLGQRVYGMPSFRQKNTLQK